jgi:hypothetical protein
MERRGQPRGRGEGDHRDGNRCVQRPMAEVPAGVALVAGRLRSVLALRDCRGRRIGGLFVYYGSVFVFASQ